MFILFRKLTPIKIHPKNEPKRLTTTLSAWNVRIKLIRRSAQDED